MNKISTSIILIVRQLFNTIPNAANLEINSELAWRIIKFLNNTKEIEDFYIQRTRAIFQDCAEKDENGQFITTNDGAGIKLCPDKMAEFQTKMTELESMAVNAPDIKFTRDEVFALCPKISLPQMNALMAFITEEDKNEINISENT